MRPNPAAVLLVATAALHVPLGSAWVGLLGTPRPPYCNHEAHPSPPPASRRGRSSLPCRSSSSSCEEGDEVGSGKGIDRSGSTHAITSTTSSGVEQPPPEQVQYGFWAPASKELQYGSWAPASKNERFGGDSREPHVRNGSVLNGKSVLYTAACI